MRAARGNGHQVRNSVLRANTETPITQIAGNGSGTTPTNSSTNETSADQLYSSATNTTISVSASNATIPESIFISTSNATISEPIANDANDATLVPNSPAAISSQPDSTQLESEPASIISNPSYCLSHFSVLNIAGLKPQTVPSKVPYVETILKETNQLFIGLTETWLKGHTQAELNIEGYRLYRSDRTGRKHTRGRYSGGVAIYLRSDIANTTEQILKFSNGVVEALVLHSQRENLLIALVYRQPDDPNKVHRSQSYEFSQAINKIESSIDSIEGTPNLIVCGDFNLPNMNWAEGLPHASQNQLASVILSFQSRQLLLQMINKPTHKAGNILDLIFTNNKQLFNEINCVPTSQSDHFIIDVSTHFKSHFSKYSQNKRTFFNTFDSLNFFSEEVNWEVIQSELRSHDWISELNQFDNVEDKLNHFIHISETIATSHVPKKKLAGSKKRIIPRDRKILMRRRRKVVKQLITVTSPSRKTKLNSELVEIELKLQVSYSKSSDYQEQKAIEAIKRNPKYFFTYVKKFSKVKSAIGPLLGANGNYIVDSKGMANELRKQYSSVFSTPLSEPVDPQQLYDSDDPSKLTDITFTTNDIVSAIEDISANAAPGPEGYPAIFLRNCKNELALPLYTIWRQALDEGITPSMLRLSLICPTHKGDSTALPKNYRPVALTSHLVKLFEKIIRKHIVDYLDQHQLFNSSQHGFRAGRSCLSQLIGHYDKVLALLEKGINVDVIYLDFAKAFDKLDFNITFSKLKQLGIDGKVGRWIHSFLTDRHQTVLVNGEKSDPAPVISGVPQGSVIGPLLFLILIGDIDSEVANAFLSSFADDTRIGMGISSQEDVSLLQEDLNKVYQWATTNNMQFNDTKFELLRYGQNKELKQSTHYLSNANVHIETKTSTKDLGVTMSATGEFSEHIDNITDTVKDLIAWIFRSFKSRSRTVMLQLWKSIVLPRLDYCSQLWNPSKSYLIQQLEELQKNFVRHIHGFSNMDYWSALKELKLYSLQRRRERYQVIYLWSIIESLVPNIANNETGDLIRVQSAIQSRRGRTISTKVLGSSRFSTLRFNSLPFSGARLFNALPKHVRNLTECSKIAFKYQLDKCLSKIPDHPLLSCAHIPAQVSSNSLSIQRAPTQHRWGQNNLVGC